MTPIRENIPKLHKLLVRIVKELDSPEYDEQRSDEWLEEKLRHARTFLNAAITGSWSIDVWRKVAMKVHFHVQDLYHFCSEHSAVYMEAEQMLKEIRIESDKQMKMWADEFKELSPKDDTTTHILKSLNDLLNKMHSAHDSNSKILSNDVMMAMYGIDDRANGSQFTDYRRLLISEISKSLELVAIRMDVL